MLNQIFDSFKFEGISFLFLLTGSVILLNYVPSKISEYMLNDYSFGDFLGEMSFPEKFNQTNNNVSFPINLNFDVNSIVETNFNPVIVEQVILFINKNYLDLILNLSKTSIENNFNGIMNNNVFFHFIKHVFSDNTLYSKAWKGADFGTESKGEFIDFASKLRECDNINDFKNITKNKNLIVYLINFIKETYKL